MLPSAIEATIRNVDHLESKSRSDGAAWRDWVVALKVFFEEHQLPSGVSKDVRVSTGFVHFLAAIQRVFPPAVREHMPQEEESFPHAIAEAAYRALIRGKLSETSQ